MQKIKKEQKTGSVKRERRQKHPRFSATRHFLGPYSVIKEVEED